MKSKQELIELLENLGDVVGFEVHTSEVNDKVELEYMSGSVDIFPTIYNAVYSFRDTVEELNDDNEELWGSDLEDIIALEDNLTSIPAKDDGKDIDIYGYSDDSVMVLTCNCLNRVCRAGCEFEELPEVLSEVAE